MRGRRGTYNSYSIDFTVVWAAILSVLGAPGKREKLPTPQAILLSMPPAKRRVHLPMLMAVVAVAITVLASCGTSPPTSPPGTSPSSPTQASGCAWPIEDNYVTSNSGLPDSGAWYWAQPFTIHQGTQIVLSGDYPDARYASFTVYSSSETPFTSNGVGSSLADFQIAPDPGSANPWRQAAPPGGHFTLTLRPRVSPGQVNVLPLAPAGVTTGVGYLEYRVYLPAIGDASHLALPDVTIEDGGSSQQLRSCTSHTMAIPPPSRQTTTTPATTPASTSTSRPAPLQFYRPALHTYFPNPETAYLIAYMAPPTASEVVVVTGKAPTSPPGAHPSIWPSPKDQVRYWSMCVNIGVGTDPVVVNHLPGGQTDLGCRADDATKLSADGTYTYVMGTEAQRTTVERVAGATFLPLSLAQPAPLYLLAMRYTLSNPTFDSAPQNIAQTGSGAAAAQTMGAYYPHARVCSLSLLAAEGASACG